MKHELRSKEKERGATACPVHASCFMLHASCRRGFSLAEILIGASIFLLALTALLTTYNKYLSAGIGATRNLKEAFLLEEGLEAVRTLRDAGFSQNIASLNASTTYYLAWSSTTSAWKSTTTPEIIDGAHERSFVLYSVYRDGNDTIAPQGTLDPNTKKVVVTVRASSTPPRSLSTYLTNLFEN